MPGQRRHARTSWNRRTRLKWDLPLGNSHGAVSGTCGSHFRTASAARAETGTSRSLSPLPRSIRNGWPGRTARRGSETNSVARRPDP